MDLHSQVNPSFREIQMAENKARLSAMVKNKRPDRFQTLPLIINKLQKVTRRYSFDDNGGGYQGL
ncbi:MAG: hypothetical protein H0U44_03110 [Flavisolibacter sp.]|jgi:hypothetical protein|nr:hypothetical protein [Flavisolibacter sp.]